MGNEFSGFREQKYENGDTYKGEFLKGRRHGRGVYITAAGHRYEGEWVNDERCGQGTLTFVSNDKHKQDASWAGTYQGQWSKNLKHGTGTFTYANGDKYVGDWVNGQKQGRGVYVFAATGDRYEGEFFANMFHGTGRYVYSNGDVFNGKWYEDEMHGTGTLTMPNGNTLLEEYDHGEKLRSLPTAWSESAPQTRPSSSSISSSATPATSNTVTLPNNAPVSTQADATTPAPTTTSTSTPDDTGGAPEMKSGSPSLAASSVEQISISMPALATESSSCDLAVHATASTNQPVSSESESVASPAVADTPKVPSNGQKSQGKSKKKKGASTSQASAAVPVTIIKEVSLDDE